ncbi:hypothetical protein D9758_008026 [Tetrapyrgos nigripes]|uniref:histidine kinase n=1 Tax=Tetrapyrgos nigripes TaxID=182062 RepID=A0A8H5D179_9AGAR|nr:hypothetical protein D9758_008026 [Tetrapyrgos nigripes]
MTSHATSSASSRKWVLEGLAMPPYIKRDIVSTPPTSRRASLLEPVSNLPPPVNAQQRPRSFSSRLSSAWSTFKANIRQPETPASSVVADADDTTRDQDFQPLETDQPENGPVESIIVDRSWITGQTVPMSSESSDQVTESKSGSGETPNPLSSTNNNNNTNSNINNNINNNDQESILHHHSWLRTRLFTYAREIKLFFYPRDEADAEEAYLEQDWHHSKTLAIWSAIWLILVWIWAFSVIPRPYQTIDYVFYTGVLLFQSSTHSHDPTAFSIMYNWPRDHRILYQVFLIIPIWMTAFYLAINIYLCGFYGPEHKVFDCNGKDFINTFYFTCALQAIGLFGLKMERLPALIGVLAYFIVSLVLIAPDHVVWGRSAVNFLVYNLFIIFVHYKKELTDRDVFRTQKFLQRSLRALHRSRQNERKTAESKYRLTSYVFHDKSLLQIRVPLNSALLAAQNMEATETVAKEAEVEFEAIMGSLNIMSQVLNDILDFNKMDAGHFELVSKPYAFHQSMRSLFIPLQIAADAKGLKLITNLDPNIDIVARCAAYKALGEKSETISKHLEDTPDRPGVVIGDEARLRQIVTNLTSNACKFTAAGGTVSVTTRLIVPSIPAGGGNPDTVEDCLSVSRLAQHNIDHHGTDSTAPDPSIVVRIEVTDTGCGISRREAQRGRLFTPFSQTERGRQQGVKGTGLGLALVKHIVDLSGGRLGVKTESGVGSTFWVELPLGVGRQTLVPGTIPVEFTDSEDSMSSDLAKVINAAIQNRDSVPETLNHPSLSAVVDAAALKATESSTSPPALRAMEQGGFCPVPESMKNVDHGFSGGPVELALLRNQSRTPSVHTQQGSKISPLPTPATDLSSNSRFPLPLISDEEAGEQPQEEENRKSLQMNGSGTDIELTSMSPDKDRSISRPTRPTHISLPQTSFKFQANSDTSSRSTPSRMHLLDSAYSRFSSTPSPRTPASARSVYDIEPGLPVLVVDDDTITRKLMMKTLERMGCQVSTAEDGMVALQLILGSAWDPSIIEAENSAFELSSRTYSKRPNGLDRPTSDKRNVSFGMVQSGTSGSGSMSSPERAGSVQDPKYALVFLDNQMPILSGLRTIRILRRLGKEHLFVVGLTGNALKHDQEQYLDAGVDKVVTKPITNQSIMEILREADNKWKKAAGVLLTPTSSPHEPIPEEPS